MPYCNNCGNKLKDGVKFCNSCGKPVQLSNYSNSGGFGSNFGAPRNNDNNYDSQRYYGNPTRNSEGFNNSDFVFQQDVAGNYNNNQMNFSDINKNTENKQEWAGKVVKCPHCGEVIPSFTAICPSCHSELRYNKGSSSLESFIQNINECDYRIASNPNKPKEGWASWSSSKRTWWVILNIFTFCIPLVIYLCMPFIRYNKAPNLSPDEQRKASLIENFPFPNERESILEALMFVKSKMASISSGSINRQSAYWSNLWSSKGEQLYAKAQTLFRDDEIAEGAHKDIIEYKKKINSNLKKQAYVGIAIVIISIVLFFCFVEFHDTEQKEKLVLPNTELGRTLPPLENKEGEIITQTSDSLVVEYEKISSREFKNYKKECDKKGFDEDVKEGDTFYEAENDDGYYLIINYSDSKMRVNVTKNK